MAVTLVGAADHGATRFDAGTPCTLTMPSGIQAGDLLFAATSIRDTTANGTLTDNASGGNSWTHIAAITTTSNLDNFSIWYKVAVAGDASATLTFNPTDKDVGAVTMVALRGADTSTVYENLSSTPVTSSGGNYTISGYTPASADGYCLIAVGLGNNVSVTHSGSTDPAATAFSVTSENPGGLDVTSNFAGAAKSNTDATGSWVWTSGDTTFASAAHLFYVPESGVAATPLTGADIATGQPTLDTGTLATFSDLTGADIAAGAPTLENGTLVEGYILEGADIATGQPTAENGTLVANSLLVHADIVTGAPTLSQGTLTAISGLTGADLATGAPTLDTGTLDTTGVLTGQDIATGAPTLEQGSLVTDGNLTGADIATGQPTVEAGTLSASSVLSGQDLAGPAAALDTGTLSTMSTLVGQDLAGPAAILDNGTLTVMSTLVGQDLAGPAAILDAGTLANDDTLQGQDISTTPILDNGTLSVHFELVGQDIVGGAPIVEPTVIPGPNLLIGRDITYPAPIVGNGVLLRPVVIEADRPSIISRILGRGGRRHPRPIQSTTSGSATIGTDSSGRRDT